jgi:hypothetical protein
MAFVDSEMGSGSLYYVTPIMAIHGAGALAAILI